jgi:ATP/ADP translocase
MVITKIMSKVMDYSIARAAKEILYIPLSYSEKTQGKAMADILGYRVAKGVASAVLMIWAATRAAFSIACLSLGVLWLGLAVALAHRFTKTERTQSELADPPGA